MRVSVSCLLLTFTAVNCFSAAVALSQDRGEGGPDRRDGRGPDMMRMRDGDRPEFRGPDGGRPEFRGPDGGRPEFRGPDGGRPEFRGSDSGRGGPPMMGRGGPPFGGPMGSGGSPWMGRSSDGGDSRRSYGPSSGSPSSSSSDSGRGRQDSGSSSDRLVSFLSTADVNRDGQLDLRELPESRRGFFESMVRRAGLDPSRPLSITSIRDAMLRGRESSSSSAGKDKKKTEPPLVPGFGEAVVLAPVPGFGVRVDTGPKLLPASSMKSSNKGSSSSSASSQSGGDRNMDERLKGFAEMMMRRSDRNHNGKLEKDEWGELRGDPKEYDRDGNGVITQDEMAARLAEYSRGGSLGSDSRSGDSDRSRRSSPSGDSKEPDLKSYRFLTVAERLPKGLPEWFGSQDANKDGQVTMAEYSTLWSDVKTQEFARIDLNNDGLVTPEECLKAGSQAPMLSQGQPSQNGGGSPRRSYWASRAGSGN